MRNLSHEPHIGAPIIRPYMGFGKWLDNAKSVGRAAPRWPLEDDTVDLSRFVRRCLRRHPQNMAHITSDLSGRK